MSRKAADLIRSDPETAATALEVGLVDRQWLNDPDAHPISSGTPTGVLVSIINGRGQPPMKSPQQSSDGDHEHHAHECKPSPREVLASGHRLRHVLRVLYAPSHNELQH